MTSISYLLLGVFILFNLSCASRVLELSDRFLEIKKDGHWLVMFYAPWCAHCKRLEPIWAHVAQALYNSNIRVGRIDCTKYTSMSSTFSISGFPTIMFLKGDIKEFTFQGDRTKDEIINFALRLSGPPVQQITRQESLDALKSSDNIFFCYTGPYEGTLWELYYDVAERFQPYSFFYSLSPELTKKHVNNEKEPSVFVYKENTVYFFPDVTETEKLNVSLTKWVNTERFGTFVKITRGNIHQFMQTSKYLVLAVVVENKLEEVPEEMIAFRNMIKSVIINHREKFHRWFQFGWIASPDLANSIAMTELPLPYLLVVNSTTNHHHFPDDEPHYLTPEVVHMFLDSIVNQTAPSYGGNSLPVRLYRTYFEARTSLSEMWRGNPVLTAVLFGLPMGFLSLICYSICCADILDADEEEDEGDYSHEKKD